MNIWNSIKSWYFATFLPFENPDHPLYHSQPEDPFCDELSEWIEAELDHQDMIGPNYSQHFSKPAEYEKWGNKWYKKSTSDDLAP